MRRGQKTSAEQVVLKLRQIEVQTAQGKSLALACKEVEISEQSYYRWCKEYGGLQVDQARKMKDLERGRAAAAAGSRSILGEAGAGGRRLGKLVAPERRRQAVDGIREKYGLSERHACRIVGQHRGTQRYVPTVLADEDELIRCRAREQHGQMRLSTSITCSTRGRWAGSAPRFVRRLTLRASLAGSVSSAAKPAASTCSASSSPSRS